MSLMEALVGRTPGHEILLGCLGIHPKNCGRLRDCFMNEELEIVIFTRNGGGNREDHKDVTEHLRSHANFVRDYDDDFDCTFAYYVFNRPKEFEKKVAQEFYDKTCGMTGTPMERFHRVMDKMNDPNIPKDDPELVNAMRVGSNIMAPLKDAMESQAGLTVTAIDSDGGTKSVRIDN